MDWGDTSSHNTGKSIAATEEQTALEDVNHLDDEEKDETKEGVTDRQHCRLSICRFLDFGKYWDGFGNPSGADVKSLKGPPSLKTHWISLKTTD